MTTSYDDPMLDLPHWLLSILANPVTKQAVAAHHFPLREGVLDARVFLRHTHGYDGWAEGQTAYESFGLRDTTDSAGYELEIARDRPVYEHYPLRGRILDCGGGAGTVREFLPQDTEFVSTDPWLAAPFTSSAARKQAYRCLSQPLAFIAATAEFQPFLAESFDWVHMRSMLDHVQVPDLALLEAWRVLKPGGRVLIGLYVEGGKTGVNSLERQVKGAMKAALETVGINRWKDHHVWHPTYAALTRLIEDNGFTIVDTYWQPQWQNMVCYVAATKHSQSLGKV